jgi:hypothetical protein
LKPDLSVDANKVYVGAFIQRLLIGQIRPTYEIYLSAMNSLDLPKIKNPIHYGI